MKYHAISILESLVHLKPIKTHLFLFLFVQVGLFSCRNGNIDETPGSGTSTKLHERSILTIHSPLAGSQLPIGSPLKIRVTADSVFPGIDSISFSVGDEHILSVNDNTIEQSRNLNLRKTGRTRLVFRAYVSDSLVASAQTSVLVVSDLVPEKWGYSIIKSYPHDSTAYTQGLVYERGFLYESTGQWGRSSLRQVELKTGEIQKSVNLPRDVFAEGLAMDGDRLIQITWKSQYGIIYDKESFRELGKVNYPMAEGWGLAFDGKNYLMSDGSEILYVMDRTSFSEIGRIEVYSDKGAVKQLNELEVAGSQIFANVYGESHIAVIDIQTGKLVATIDFSKLIPARYKNNLDRALNGIALDKTSGHFYITGKDWPLVYEVALRK